MIIGYWSSLSFITFIAILYVKVSSMLTSFLVPYYMIHDIIYWDLIFSTISGTWGSSGTKSLIMSNESFEISTFSIRWSSSLAYFLNREFLSLEPIGLSRFKRVFETIRPTTLQACYELISNIFGALAVDIYDLVTFYVSKNIW